MSSQESRETKTTLKEHHQNFKKLEAKVEDLRTETKRKLMKEIQALEEKDKKEVERVNARKRALALKGYVLEQVYTQDDRAADEVPVDGELKAGTMIFTKHCSVCHSLEAIDPKPQKGPSLGLVYNRRAGSNLSFQGYTDQLLKSTFFWTPKNLYRFMADANSLVPKTTCRLAKHPLTSEQERADLIKMFREFTIETSFYIRWKEIQRSGYTHFQTQLNTERIQHQHGRDRDKRAKKFDASV